MCREVYAQLLTLKRFIIYIRNNWRVCWPVVLFMYVMYKKMYCKQFWWEGKMRKKKRNSWLVLWFNFAMNVLPMPVLYKNVQSKWTRRLVCDKRYWVYVLLMDFFLYSFFLQLNWRLAQLTIYGLYNMINRLYIMLSDDLLNWMYVPNSGVIM